MPSTPIYALPYPALSDTADVPRDIQALATRLDGLLQPTLVSALPGAPVDGQEIYYQNAAMATAGVAWHLRYNAASASPYKWEFIGGARLGAEVLTSEAITTTAFADLATVGPQVTAPLAGEYMILMAAMLTTALAVGATAVAAPNIAGAAPVGNDNMIVGTPAAAAQSVTVSRELRSRTLAAPGLIKLQYAQSGGNAAAARRSLSITPIRVG